MEDARAGIVSFENRLLESPRENPSWFSTMAGESAGPGKRRLRTYSVSTKMNAIQRVLEGESKASVARDIGAPESTLRGWCKCEHKIRNMACNFSSPGSATYSPLSSSDAGNNEVSGNANNLAIEGMTGPCTKKSKTESHDVVPVFSTSHSSNDLSAMEANATQNKAANCLSRMVSNNGKCDSSSTDYKKKVDAAMWLWLMHQPQLTGQEPINFDPGFNQKDGSWFWQWYKKCNYPLPTSTPGTPNAIAKKSPSKVKALLDNILYNNSNDEETEKQGSNRTDEEAQPEPGDNVCIQEGV